MMLSRLTSVTSDTASYITSTFNSTTAKITDNYYYLHLSDKVAHNYKLFSEQYPYISESLNNTRSTINDGTTYIYSLPASFRYKIYSYASLLQPVDGSEEREFTRTPPNENLGENVITLKEDRIELVNYILDLYEYKPSKECFKYYADDVIYEDQIMYTTGLSNLKAQFYGMPKVFKSTTVNYKILENTLNTLRISLNQKYVIPIIARAFVLNSEIVLEFNENQKVSKHADLWYGKEPVYKGEILRKGAAKIVSSLVKIPEN